MLEDTFTEAFRYTGHEELEQVRLIQRYNRHIADLFLAAVEPGQALLDFGAGIGTISTLVRERARAANILCVEVGANDVVALKREGFDVITDAQWYRQTRSVWCTPRTCWSASRTTLRP